MDKMSHDIQTFRRRLTKLAKKTKKIQKEVSQWLDELSPSVLENKEEESPLCVLYVDLYNKVTNERNNYTFVCKRKKANGYTVIENVPSDKCTNKWIEIPPSRFYELIQPVLDEQIPQKEDNSVYKAIICITHNPTLHFPFDYEVTNITVERESKYKGGKETCVLTKPSANESNKAS